MIKSAFIAVLLMALVTYLPRMLPITLFRKNVTSKYLKAFFDYVPFAVLSALTFPDIFYSTTYIYSAVAGCVVALFLAYHEKSLVVVALFGILTVFLSEWIPTFLTIL